MSSGRLDAGTADGRVPTPHLDGGGVAVVTGAARGIGLAIASALLGEGVRVAGLDTDAADWDALLAAAASAQTAVRTLAVDVRDQRQVREAVDGLADWGDVRYGVNAAGVDHLGDADDLTAADWSRVVDVDLSGVFFSCQAEHAGMRRHGRGGAIVNIASMSGSIVNRGVRHVPYGAAKAGVVHLSRSLGVEWVADGVRVNSVSPGYTATEMTRGNAPEVNAALVDAVPMGRMATVQEIAAPVLFLLGAGASYITAVDLVVDGGCTAW